MVNYSNEMGLQEFATISGIKGGQFNKEVFSAVLKFKDLDRFLQVFPEVQRQASGRKINSIKNYILTGIEDNSSMRYFSALTVTTRGHVFYDESKHRIAIDTNNSKLSINDGQHRYNGIVAAIEELKRRISKTNDYEKVNKYEEMLSRLESMVMPLVIFNNLSETEEKQLFYDLNNLATKPSRSATIRLAQSDNLSRMARELSETNDYLIRYGVETNKMSIHSNNKNTILLTTVYEMCKLLYQDELKQDKNYISDEIYEQLKEDTNNIFNKIFNALPQDLDVKNKYITSKSFALRGIAKFINDVMTSNKYNHDNIYKAIANVDWKENFEYWEQFGAKTNESGNLEFPNHNVNGIVSVKNACITELKKINN